jgi:hypothetical protein
MPRTKGVTCDKGGGHLRKQERTSSTMPMDVLNDMLFRQLQFLELVLAEIPQEQLKTEYSIMIQERIVELDRILYKGGV